MSMSMLMPSTMETKMSKKGKQYILDPSRNWGIATLLSDIAEQGIILTYDEPYDIPNDSRDYYTCVKDGKTHCIVLEPFEVIEVQKSFIPVDPYDPASDVEVAVAVGQGAGGPGGMKYDGGKPRMALLFDGCPNALEAVASVLTFGAQKYAAHSWQSVPEGEERYKSALLRHLTAVGKGEELDPESGLHHLAHAACNALFILELALRKTK